jgi:hypothetical protein
VYTKFLNALVTIQYFAFSGSDSQLGTIDFGPTLGIAPPFYFLLNFFSAAI